MWTAAESAFVKHTGYDPFSTPQYSSPDQDFAPAGQEHREVDVPENPGTFEINDFQGCMKHQKVPFAVDASSILIDEEYCREHLLRKDLDPDEIEEICARSWKIETKVRFAAIIGILISCGLMITYTENEVLCYSKYFQVPKGDDKWRIIADSRRAGRLCVAPGPTNLPHIRTMLMEIAMLGSTHAVIGDWRNFFYAFPINKLLRSMFAIVCDGVFAAMRCLPMGFPASPRIAISHGWGCIIYKEETEECLGIYETWTADPPTFIRLRDREGGKTVGLIFLWIDNVAVFCTDRGLRDKWHERLMRNAKRFNLPWKNLCKTSTPTFIGIHFKMDEAKGVQWQHETARTKKWKEPAENAINTPRDVARLVGIIIWHSMVALSPLYKVKDAIDIMRRVAKSIVTKSSWDKSLVDLGVELSRKEEKILRQHVRKAIQNPWCGTDVSEASETVYACTDACKEDTSKYNPEDPHKVLGRAVNGAGGVLFGSTHADAQYMAHQWTDAERNLDIYLLEMKAIVKFLDWLPVCHQKTRLVLGVDNTVCVAALTRVYSSCSILCRYVQEAEVLLKAKNYVLQVIWVPGVENAADPASRGMDPCAQRNENTWKILHGAPPKTARVGKRGRENLKEVTAAQGYHSESDDDVEEFEVALGNELRRDDTQW